MSMNSRLAHVRPRKRGHSTGRPKRVHKPHVPIWHGPEGRPISQGKPKAVQHIPHKPGERNSKVRVTRGKDTFEAWNGSLKRKSNPTREAARLAKASTDHVARYLVVPDAIGSVLSCPSHYRDIVTRSIWSCLWHGRPGKGVSLKIQARALRYARRKPSQRIAIPAELPNAEQLIRLVPGTFRYA